MSLSMKRLRACLHEGGGPQIGEVTFGGSPHLSCKRDQIKMRHFMDRRVTSPTWGPLPPCKQALRVSSIGLFLSCTMMSFDCNNLDGNSQLRMKVFHN